MPKQRAPVRRRDGQSEWLVPVLWQWSSILKVVLFLKNLQQLVKFSQVRAVNKMKAIVVGYRSNSCDSSIAWTHQCLIQLQLLWLTFALAYSELFSLCFMFYFVTRFIYAMAFSFCSKGRMSWFNIDLDVLWSSVRFTCCVLFYVCRNVYYL